MKKMKLKTNNYIKEKDTKRNFSIKVFAPRKIDPRQMKMKSTTIIQKEYYL